MNLPEDKNQDESRLRVAAERDSQTCADDRTADAVRMGAPETRRLVRMAASADAD